jgi:hypothetical protein
MSRSQGAVSATAIVDAPYLGGTGVTTHVGVLAAPAGQPAIGDRCDSALVNFGVGQSERRRSVWESPRRGAARAAYKKKRAGKGGRAVWIRVSDGPVMDRIGRLCTTARFASGLARRAG